MPERAPAWAHRELDRIAKGAETGLTTFEHANGVFRKATRGEIICPPVEAADQVDGDDLVLPPQKCPADGAPLAEFDYGCKFRCAKCDTVYSLYTLREGRKLIAPEASGRLR